jgi:hypothetical protein
MIGPGPLGLGTRLSYSRPCCISENPGTFVIVEKAEATSIGRGQQITGGKIAVAERASISSPAPTVEKLAVWKRQFLPIEIRMAAA